MKINDQQRSLCCDIDRWSAEWMREIYGKLYFFWKKNKPIELDFHNRQFGTVAKISKKNFTDKHLKKTTSFNQMLSLSTNQTPAISGTPSDPFALPHDGLLKGDPNDFPHWNSRGSTHGFLFGMNPPISLKLWVWIGSNCSGDKTSQILLFQNLDLWSAFSQQSPCPVSASGFSFKCLARIVCPRQIHPLRHQ